MHFLSAGTNRAETFGAKDRRDQIGKYWDQQPGDIGQTNKVDGRNGKPFVSTRPKPPLAANPTKRYHMGRLEVKVPGGQGGYKWIPK